MFIFENLLHPLERKLFLHLKEATLHPKSKKSMLDMPVPGSFRNIGHQIEANKA